MPKKSTPAAQFEKFKAAARELGTDESEAAFENTLRRIAKAPPAKVEKAVKKSKK